MAHSREIRSRASEVKFVITPEIAAAVSQWARTHLEGDLHGGGPFGDEYRTTSLYFDNDRFDVFHRRGSQGRSKYRIRRYGTSDVIFLERKMRQPAVLAKRRTCTHIDALERLAPPPGSDLVFQHSAESAGWPGHWFQQRVLVRQLQPVCQISYSRTARVAVRDGETVRLTLDAGLSAQLTHGFRFSDGESIPVLPDRMILELKYRGTAPAIFRRLVEEFALTPRAASKYRMGLAALGTLEPRLALMVSGNEAQASHA